MLSNKSFNWFFVPYLSFLLSMPRSLLGTPFIYMFWSQSTQQQQKILSRYLKIIIMYWKYYYLYIMYWKYYCLYKKLTYIYLFKRIPSTEYYVYMCSRRPNEQWLLHMFKKTTHGMHALSFSFVR